MDKQKFEELFGDGININSYAEDEKNTYRIFSIAFLPLIGEVDISIRVIDKQTQASRNELVEYNFGVKDELSKPEIQRKKRKTTK